MGDRRRDPHLRRRSRSFRDRSRRRFGLSRNGSDVSFLGGPHEPRGKRQGGRVSTQQSRAHGSVGTAPEEALTPTSTLADTDTNAGTVTKADTFASLDAVANTDGNADGDRSTSTGGTVPKGTQRRALLAASVTLVLWASAFVVIRMVGSAYSAGGLAFGRMASAAVVLGVIAVLRHQVRVPDRRALFPIVGYGVAWFGGYTVVLNLAEQHLDAGTASLLV